MNSDQIALNFYEQRPMLDQNRWLTVKQANWLYNVWTREASQHGWRSGGHKDRVIAGSFDLAGVEYKWKMILQQNGAGAFVVVNAEEWRNGKTMAKGF